MYHDCVYQLELDISTNKKYNMSQRGGPLSPISMVKWLQKLGLYPYSPNVKNQKSTSLIVTHTIGENFSRLKFRRIKRPLSNEKQKYES